MTVPVFERATPDTGLRPRRVGGKDLPVLVETLVAAFVDDPVMAWVIPDSQPTGEQAEQLVGWYLEVIEENSERFLAAIEQMGECHPQEPHDYLFFLGTRPKWQSRGLGSALLREVLERCDREGRPAYLEATNEGCRLSPPRVRSDDRDQAP